VRGFKIPVQGCGVSKPAFRLQISGFSDANRVLTPRTLRIRLRKPRALVAGYAWQSRAGGRDLPAFQLATGSRDDWSGDREGRGAWTVRWPPDSKQLRAGLFLSVPFLGGDRTKLDHALARVRKGFKRNEILPGWHVELSEEKVYSHRDDDAGAVLLTLPVVLTLTPA
jgi:hypothetical protein